MSARGERSVTRKADSDIESEFKHLVERWRRDTAIESSSSKIVLHPAYQRIIGMGKAALPLILADLEAGPAHWSWALRAITGESPDQSVETGDIAAAREAWLRWGRQRKYLN